MNKKLLLEITVLIEILILSLFTIRAFKPSTLLDIPADLWVHSSTDTPTISSPYFYITKGSYLIDIIYSSKEDTNIYIYSDADNSDNLQDNTITLHNQKGNEQFEFEASGPVDNVQAVITYTNSSDFTLDSIALYRTRNIEKRQLIYILLCFLLLDIFLFFNDAIIKHKKILLGILTITFLASLPLFSYGIEVGHDLDFHLMRIEGIRQELLAGHFPVRIQSYYNYGHGYPVSIFYGDILLYFPAILRIFGFQSIQAYKIYTFSINLFTVIFCYYAGIRIWKKGRIALLFSAAFTLSSYRFIDIYVRNAVGEYTAMMFFPLIALGLYELYYSNKSTENLINKRGFFCISIGMAGIITTHILTTEMVCIFLFIFVVLHLKKTFKTNTLCTIGFSIINTFLITAWFTIPFIDYYLNVPVKIRDTTVEVAHIQSNGAYLTQYFTFFKNIFGTRSELITERMSITPGLLLMGTLCFAVYLWINRKITILPKKLTISSIFLLFICSNLFPWNNIAENKLGNFLSQIQFPWRWLMFSCLILSLLLGCIVNELEEYSNFNISKTTIYSFIILLLVIQLGFDNSSYANDASNIQYPKYATDMNGTDYREYYRSSSDFFSLTYNVIGSGLKDGYLVSQNGTDYVFKISMNNSSDVTLPILNYKGYQVQDSTGKLYEIFDNAQKEVTISLPGGFDDMLYVSFKESFLWRLSDVISAISLFVLLFIFKKNI